MKLYVAIAHHYTWDGPVAELFTNREQAYTWLSEQRSDYVERDPEFFIGEIREKELDTLRVEADEIAADAINRPLTDQEYKQVAERYSHKNNTEDLWDIIIDLFQEKEEYETHA